MQAIFLEVQKTMKKHLLLALKWLAGILLVLIIAVIWLYNRDRAPSGAPMGEQMTDNESFVTAAIIRDAIDTSVQERTKLVAATANHVSPPPSSDATAPGYRADTFRRDAHPKGHGCVKATFKVDKVQDQLAFGVFAHPGQYDAVIRFSSGSPTLQPDSKKDARGMAIKLFNVPGKKLLPLEEDDTTQDFILMNNPVFFIRTIEEYAQFNQMLAYGNAQDYFINFGNPLKWHLREFRLGLATQKPRPDSLVTTRWYSASAYALGPNNYVKYSVVPCAGNKPMPPDTRKAGDLSYDYLRLELANQAAKGEACFDFMVQPQVPGKNMPVEDTTVEWKESDSPFVKVASLNLKVDPDSNSVANNTACEAMSFNPWHSLVEHRPVGVMNRVRKALYQEMAAFRRGKNCPGFCEEKCAAKGCATGCVERCTAACPLLNEPASADLPADVCRSQQVSQTGTLR
jgi:Catalase